MAADGTAPAEADVHRGRRVGTRQETGRAGEVRRGEGSTVMVSDQEMSAAIGGTAYGTDGDKLGTIEAFFADDRTGAPTWVSVSTGLFGTRHSVVPVGDATFTDGALHIPVTADAVKSAPSMAGEHLDPADEEALRQHYGVTTGLPGGHTEASPAPSRSRCRRTRTGRHRPPARGARRGPTGRGSGRHRFGGRRCPGRPTGP